MSYANQQDLIDRYGEGEIRSLSDRAGTGAIDDIAVARALADADATINSYVGRRYHLPLSSVPDRLARVACDLARRYLSAERPLDDVLAAEKAAMAWLRDVSTGAATLDVAGIEPPTTGIVMVEESRPLFADLRRGGW